jgi:hypothetical protein
LQASLSRFLRWETPFLRVLFRLSSRVSANQYLRPPLLGANEIFVEPGDYVEADEIVAVIETDKVNVDIRSTHSGQIKKYFANEGDTVAVDSDFFELDTDAKGGAKKEAAPAKEAAPKKEEKVAE